MSLTTNIYAFYLQKAGGKKKKKKRQHVGKTGISRKWRSLFVSFESSPNAVDLAKKQEARGFCPGLYQVWVEDPEG